LRYELTPPFVDQVNNLLTVYVPHIYHSAGAPQSDWPYFVRQGNCDNAYTANPPIPIRWDANPAIVTPAVCSNGLLPDALMKTRYTDFAPRFGIAYSPDAKTVVRAGFGIFYSQDNGNSPYFDLARNLAVRNTYIANTPWDGKFSNTGAPANYANAFPVAGGATVHVAAPYAYSDNPEHHTASTMQYLLNVQRQFGSSWSLEVGYLGSLSHHMAGFYNQNQGVPNGGIGSAVSHTPFLDFGFIQSVEDSANGVYNAFSFKATKRYSGGFSLTAAYTHAISIDDSSAIRIQGYDTLFPQNSNCQRCERNFSSFDTRNRLVVAPLYELPIGKGKRLNVTNRVANVIIGGWQVGGILTLQSGIPQTITIGGGDNSVTTTGYDRPNSTGISSTLDNPDPNVGWYNRAAFVQAPRGFFGNLGRNTATAPGIYAVNAEVHKNFVMPYNEHHQVQFRAEAFNLLNHPNWGGPNGNINAGGAIPGQPANAPHAGFGVINTLATGIDMRQLQLGLKYTF